MASITPEKKIERLAGQFTDGRDTSFCYARRERH